MQIDDPVKPSTASLARLGSLIAPYDLEAKLRKQEETATRLAESLAAAAAA
jgi:hypothetical protein